MVRRRGKEWRQKSNAKYINNKLHRHRNEGLWKRKQSATEKQKQNGIREPGPSRDFQQMPIRPGLRGGTEPDEAHRLAPSDTLSHPVSLHHKERKRQPMCFRKALHRKTRTLRRWILPPCPLQRHLQQHTCNSSRCMQTAEKKSTRIDDAGKKSPSLRECKYFEYYVPA